MQSTLPPQVSRLQAPKAAEAGVTHSHRARPRHSGRYGALSTLVFFLDFAVVSLALSLAWWIRFETPLAQVGTPLSPGITVVDYFGHIFFGSALMVVILFNFRAYEPCHLLFRADDLKILLRGTAVWLVAFLGLWLTLKFQPSISRIYCFLGAACIFPLLAVWRRSLVRHILPTRLAHKRRQIVLVGSGSSIDRIAESYQTPGVKPFDLLGVFLPGTRATPSPPLRKLPLLGGYQSLLTTLHSDPPDAVLVSERDIDGTQLAEIAEACERELVDFELVPSCFPSLNSGLSMRHVYGVPVLSVGKLPLHSNLNRYFKRAFDIVGASVGLIVSAPIIAVLGMLIRREGPGSIFYRQTRVGLDGRPFEIIKLRSMRLDAEANNRPGWTVADDPRCLRIGKFMRAWNLDELPQFWNVLKGEMSLVGPRPERPQLIAKFKGEILHYNARHSVKPGITGWAQVNGLRGDTDLSERIRHDLHYIEHWNPLLDVIILIRTFLTRKGAC